MKIEDWVNLRYGLFVHYGLYSGIGRGEWSMNREQISPVELRKIAEKFNPINFNADEICRLAVDGGMKYIVFTTMHHEGFRLYDTKLSDFNSVKYTGRNLVQEIKNAAAKYDLKLGLYHSLNNWFDTPDAVDALENPEKYQIFIKNTFARLKELAELFADFDVMWYDGWWPFNELEWQAEKMNEMIRAIMPDVLFNGRNCLPGDFGTPEGHLTAPAPWRPWESCITLNDHWGFHQSDHNWKSPLEVIKMLLFCGNHNGNLLLNIGPEGDGSIPETSRQIIRQVGKWLKNGGREAISSNDVMTFSPGIADLANERGDWDHAGIFTSSQNNLFLTMLYPVDEFTLPGLNCQVKQLTVNGKPLNFTRTNGKIKVSIPEELQKELAPVLKFECTHAPAVYRTGGMRIPQVKHPRYDPIKPDIAY